MLSKGPPRWCSDKESARQCRRHWFHPWVGKIPWSRKEMAMHSSILAWKIAWTEEPGGLQSMGLQSWTWLSGWAHTYTHTHTHTHVSSLSNQTSLMPSFFTYKMRKQDIVISRFFPVLKHSVIWLCNRLHFSPLSCHKSSTVYLKQWECFVW